MPALKISAIIYFIFISACFNTAWSQSVDLREYTQSLHDSSYSDGKAAAFYWDSAGTEITITDSLLTDSNNFNFKIIKI